MVYQNLNKTEKYHPTTTKRKKPSPADRDSKCGSREGSGGPDPPGKSQVIWVSIGYKQLDPLGKVGPSMIPIKTIVIEQVRRDISSVKHAYVKLACNRVISLGISHIACESVITAIRTFMFGCLFSIFHHAIKNVSLIENTDQTFSL